MIIFPAIDLLGGNCVRLYKGEYDTAGKVAEDPIMTARSFVEAGAEYIHTVDLDGAKNGEGAIKNRRAVYEICKNLDVKVELGGGLRTMRDLDEADACGVDRMILGSAATDLDFLQSALDKYGDRIAVGIDAKNGYVATAGWINTTSLYYLGFAKQIDKMGVKTIIFTDISRDGTLTGPNTEMLRELADAVNCDITASGGIKSIDDIEVLCKMGLYGSICGKSIYSGTLDLREAIELSKNYK